LGTQLLLLTQPVLSPVESRQQLREHLESGRALDKFHEMVQAQGGDLDKLTKVAEGRVITAERSGYVSSIDTEQLGLVIIELGGGRLVLLDTIDHSVGLEMLARLGEKIDSGQPLVRVFAGNSKTEGVLQMIRAAIAISDQPPTLAPLIVERITTREEWR
jgi:thymidine phosphorylase